MIRIPVSKPCLGPLEHQLVTVCFTYFKSLTLANLAAALYSVSKQNLSRVAEIVVADNDTTDDVQAIQAVIEVRHFSAPVRFVSFKHDDSSKAQAWSTNATVRLAATPWVFYTRADYLLDFNMLAKFLAVLDSKPSDWDGFVVSNGCHLGSSVEDCESTDWRVRGPCIFRGAEYDYTEIDSGVWMARRDTYDRVGGFDEQLSAWGHAQTDFQYRIHLAGVEFVRIPETLFWHPFHGSPRNIDLAHAQLAARGGVSIQTMWERYPGQKFY